MARPYVLNEASLIRGKRISGHLSLEDRFWLQVKKTRTCWLWIGCKDKDGYGIIRVNSRGKRATHIAVNLCGKVVPKGMQVCHTCDNPSCVKPKHLFIGTRSDNMQDAKRKGRNYVKHGELCNFSKLTATTVLKIRRRYEEAEPYRGLFRAIAEEFGISRYQAYKIIKRQQWKHV